MFKTISSNINDRVLKLNNYFKVNITVLIILCLVAQHSFLIKFISLGIVTILNLDSIKISNLKKIPLFYLLTIVLEVLKFIFINDDFSFPHSAQFLVGITYWISSLILCLFIYNAVNNQTYVKRSIDVFTILNFSFSIFQIVKICFIENSLNPYNTGHNHPYGISTGDLINGLLHGVHLTNVFISLMLILYYINESKTLYVLLSIIPFLLTGSNYATIILFIACGVFFFLNRKLHQKSLIIFCMITTFLFYWLITPLNAQYMIEKLFHISKTIPNTNSDLTKENVEKSKPYKEVVLPDTIHPYIHDEKTSQIVIIKNNEKSDSTFDFIKQSGKIRSYYQTKDFITASWNRLLFGSGMGGFSSKLAFNSSGVMDGSTLNKYIPPYETNHFKSNHKALYAYLKTQHIMFQSESNRPFSVYNQLLSEYGLIGFILFVVFYIIYFFRRINKNTYALPILISLLFIFNLDYFVESLSILIFFELLLFIDISRKNSLKNDL